MNVLSCDLQPVFIISVLFIYIIINQYGLFYICLVSIYYKFVIVNCSLLHIKNLYCLVNIYKSISLFKTNLFKQPTINCKATPSISSIPVVISSLV